MSIRTKIMLCLVVTVAALGVALGVGGAAWLFRTDNASSGHRPAAAQANSGLPDTQPSPLPSSEAAAMTDLESTNVDSAAMAGVLRPGVKLTAGQKLTSKSGTYVLTLQTDGNLVLADSANKALWSSQTHGHPGAYARFQTDGNLVVYAPDDRPLWHTATTGAGALFAVHDDGNAVVYNATGKGVWASKIEHFKLYPSQGLTTGQSRKSIDGRYTLVQYPDGNLAMVDSANKAIWSSQTHGNPGAYTHLGGDGNLVVYSAAKKPLWQSGTVSNSGAGVYVQNDGNTVIRGADNSAIWGTATHGVSMLTMNQRLMPGQSRKSPNGSYTLYQQTDGNLVLREPAGNAIWATATSGANPWTVMQPDGNLVVYNGTTALWSTKTNPGRGAFLLVQDDGNLVLYSADKKVVWNRSA